MHTKIISWLESRSNIEFEIDIENDKWVIVLTYHNALLHIYSDEIDKIRIEANIRIPAHFADKTLIKSVYTIAYDNGLCICPIEDAPLSVYLYKYGVAIPRSVLTKKSFFYSLNNLIVYADALQEFIMSYINSVDNTYLDLSMFTSKDVSLQDLNLDILVQMREVKFGGSWDAFRKAISLDDSEKAQKLVKYIDKCIEFEDKNQKDLAEVHQQVKEELAIIFEELANDNITYN